MSHDVPVEIRALPTGVPGMDEILGGGIAEFSFNVIAGGPGAGKTTLAQQILFRNASLARPAVFFTVLGEPTIKLLRYQQQFSFFEQAKMGAEVRVLNLSEEVLRGGFDAVLARIVTEVEATRPALVVVDSFRTVMARDDGSSGVEPQRFVQSLALHLTSWEVTSFLIGEYAEMELHDPVLTVADGLLWLTQEVHRNSVVRKLQVVKQRGFAPMAGLHTMRITGSGVEVFPRIVDNNVATAPRQSVRRLSTGILGLDGMMGGGIPAGDAVIVAGPTGAGKTTFATRFLADGAARGESSVVLVFEERPEDFLGRARALGLDLEPLIAEGRAALLYLRPLDLSVDEILHEVRAAVTRVGASRVVIDSLSGFELALAPTFREDFRESLYRLVCAITGAGVTILMTVETVANVGSLRLLPFAVSFLADDVIQQRYVEIEGTLRTILTIVKMRGSQHSRALREYEITGGAVTIGRTLHEYDDILSGAPRLRIPAQPQAPTTRNPLCD